MTTVWIPARGLGARLAVGLGAGAAWPGRPGPAEIHPSGRRSTKLARPATRPREARARRRAGAVLELATALAPLPDAGRRSLGSTHRASLARRRLQAGRGRPGPAPPPGGSETPRDRCHARRATARLRLDDHDPPIAQAGSSCRSRPELARRQAASPRFALRTQPGRGVGPSRPGRRAGRASTRRPRCGAHGSATRARPAPPGGPGLASPRRHRKGGAQAPSMHQEWRRRAASC